MSQFRCLSLHLWCSYLVFSIPFLLQVFAEEVQFLEENQTNEVFGNDFNEIFPVAYFDVNADKLTDLITTSKDRQSIIIFLGHIESPFLQRACDYQLNIQDLVPDKHIVSIRPGDFTGDGLADLMITVEKTDHNSTEHGNQPGHSVDIIFCQIEIADVNISLQCPGAGEGSIIKDLVQEPMTLDINGDMVLDLLGEQVKSYNSSVKKQRIVLISQNMKESFEWNNKTFHVQDVDENYRSMAKPSSNAYADIDGDGIPELIILTEEITMQNHSTTYFIETYEIIEVDRAHVSFKYKQNSTPIKTVGNDSIHVVGQPIIMDFEHTGTLVHLLPYCLNFSCEKFGVYAIDKGIAINIPVTSLEYEGASWSFIPPPNPFHYDLNQTDYIDNMEMLFSKTISLRVGDFNLDGFPDLLGVMTNGKHYSERVTRAVMFENVPCPSKNAQCYYTRSFAANFEMFSNYKNVTSASFYDIEDNGVLDVILATQSNQSENFVVQAVKNDMGFDSVFIKVMVLSGYECLQCPSGVPYGNVLPGATVRYSSLNNSGLLEFGVIAQTYRTSHMPLDLPWGTFGVRHSPNFIETLNVTIAPNSQKKYTREWLQIIPNSQIVIVPGPIERPHVWTMKLFLTPSDAVLKTFVVLVGICMILATMAGALEFKERREDRRVRQTEAHRLALAMY